MVLQISVQANQNQKIHDKVKEYANMCEALKELMKDEIDKANEDGKIEGRKEDIAQGAV